MGSNTAIPPWAKGSGTLSSFLLRFFMFQFHSFTTRIVFFSQVQRTNSKTGPVFVVAEVPPGFDPGHRDAFEAGGKVDVHVRSTCCCFRQGGMEAKMFSSQNPRWALTAHTWPSLINLFILVHGWFSW
jgi:hypothetical protein